MARFLTAEDGYWKKPDNYNVDEGVRMAFFVLGDNNSETAPIAVILDLEPGQVVSHHAHRCERFEVVVKGSMYVDDELLRPGDVMTTGPGEFYGPHIAGPEGCMVVEVLEHATDSLRPLYKTADGSVHQCDVRKTGRPTDAVNMDPGLEERVSAVLSQVARLQ